MTTPSRSPKARSFFARNWAQDPGIGLLLVFALLLWWSDYPMPHVDDLFFTGASVELARTGELTNPWIRSWLHALGSERFFCLPPVLPYALAAWLKCFGVCSYSLTGFHVAVQLLLQLLVYRSVRLSGGSIFIGVAAALIAFLFAIAYGMRPDALAVCLTVLGFLGFQKSRPAWWLAGSFLCSSAAMVHPLALALVIPGFLFFWLNAATAGAAPIRSLVWTAAGCVLAGIMFLVEIEGRILEFLQVLTKARHLVSALPWYARPIEFWSNLRLGWEGLFYGVMFVLVIGAAIVNWQRRADPDARRSCALFVAWAAALVIGIFIYPGRALHYVCYAGLILAIATTVRWRYSAFVTVASLTVALAHNAGSVALLLKNPGRPEAAAFLRVAGAHKDANFCLDEVAARYVFDFRLPPGAQDWLLRNPPSRGPRADLREKPPNEIWFLNEWKLERYVPDANVHAQRLSVGPLTINSLPNAPYRLHVLW